MPLTSPPRRHGIARLALPLALLGALAAPAGAQTLVLKNIPPGEILQYFSSSRSLPLPAGVRRITVRPQDNALVVDATPEGFSVVREIVDNLDVATRRVTLTVSFVRVSDAQAAALGVFAPPSDGPGAVFFPAPPAPGVLAAFLQSAKPAQAQVTTSNNVPTSLTLPAPGVRSVSLTLTPRANADDTVTLTTYEQVAEEFSGAVGPGVTASAPTVTRQYTRTVLGGEPLLFTERLFDAGGTTPNDLLIIVTPALLADRPAAGAPAGRG